EIARKEDSAEQWFGLTDHVLVNTGNGDSRQLFFPEQAGQHVLFPQQLPPTTEADPENADPRIPAQYIGLTNAELRTQYGFSLGGTLPSVDAVDQPDDRISGLTGTPVPDPFPLPEVDDPLDDSDGQDDDGDGDDEVDSERLTERIHLLRAESDSRYTERLNAHDWEPGERIQMEPLLNRLRAIGDDGIQAELDELDSQTLSHLDGLLEAFVFDDESGTGNETDVVIEIPESGTGDVQVLLDDGHVVVLRGSDELQRRSLADAATLRIEGTAGDDRLEFDLTDAAELQLQSITINGREGNDDIRLTGLAGELARILSLNGNAGDDRLAVTGTIEAGVLMNGDAGNDTLWGGRAGDTLHGGAGNDELQGDAGNDVLTGGDGDDRLNGHGGRDTLSGDAGHDHLNSHGGHDVLRGGDGNDRIRGGAGHDLLAGGNGRDRLYGQYGRDTLHGGADDDRLLGDAGNDLLRGGDGHDILDGHGGRDTLSGGAGNDRLTGHGGHDVLSGDDGNDWLRGRSGNDVLTGGNGDDRLDGQQGGDSLHGGNGKDRLKGGGGQDILFGSDGNDWISGQAGRDTVVTGAGEDQVTGPVSEIDEDFAWFARWIDLV
ncbi:MAG: calcium-binding protein, partial [Planctomycetaceae bacterium]